MYRKFIGNLYITFRMYAAIGGCFLLFVAAYFFPFLFFVAKMAWFLFVVLVMVDYWLLFIMGKSPDAKRNMAERFSNGDENKVTIELYNTFPFDVKIDIIDELPFQFQKRDWKLSCFMKRGQKKTISYGVRPTGRGEYNFGNIILYTCSNLGLLQVRHDVEAQKMVPVYPSFIQLRRYELLSQTTIPSEFSSRRLRRLGHSTEFEQIKEYVRGDDSRTLNWKATARKAALMVNSFSDEKSQQVYFIIDKGRLMKMPFNNLSLLDYAINSTLVLGNVCLKRQDKIGVVTFANKMGTLLQANRRPIQKANFLKLLYSQETAFLESDFEMLYLQLRANIRQRSLLILFTNFESLSGLKRQLPYLRVIAKHHLLLVVFFENTELQKLSTSKATNIEDVYVKTIAEKFSFEKKLIVKELTRHGILSILSTPEKLTVNTINKYLELKAKQAL